MQEIILKNNLSDHFELIKYPDGQHTIKLHIDKLNIKERVVIKCRIRNFAELEVLMCLVQALHKYDFVLHEIQYMYLFGMRSDRAFQVGEPNYREVLCKILSPLSLNKSIFFPHSELWITSEENNSFDKYYLKIKCEIELSNYYTIAGDKSALKHFPYYCLNNYFEKTRRMSGMSVNLCEEIKTDKPILIMDDLCDGGATFMREGEYLKERYPDKSLTLFVAHGLFTQGVHPLLTYFDKIICTNSYQDIDHPNVQQIKVI